MIHLRYLLRNEGTAPLLHVELSDSLPVSSLSCPAATDPLAPGTARVCEANLRAQPGIHHGSADATGTEPLPSIDAKGPGPARTVHARDGAGYEAVAVVPGRVTSDPTASRLTAAGRAASGLSRSTFVAGSKPLPHLGIGTNGPVSVTQGTRGTQGTQGTHTASDRPNQSSSSTADPALTRAGGQHPSRRRRHVLGLLLVILLAVIVPVLATRRSFGSSGNR
jgi:hypothetical protein